MCLDSGGGKKYKQEWANNMRRLAALMFLLLADSTHPTFWWGPGVELPAYICSGRVLRGFCAVGHQANHIEMWSHAVSR